MYIAMALPVPTQLVLYDNDAVEVSYSDGSCLQLAPCGAVFIHQAAPSENCHPLADQWIQQYSQFVTSTYRPFLQEAVDFRNRFAEKPYVCQQVVDDDAIVWLEREVVEVVWPDPCPVSLAADGSLSVSALDSHVRLTLSPCRQFVSVSFLCRAGQCRGNPHRSNKGKDTSAADSSHTTTSLKTPTQNATLSDSETSGGRWAYVRVTQHHSVDGCSAVWKHPLSSLLRAARKNCNTVRFGDTQANDCQSEDDSPQEPNSETKMVYVSLPKSLPINCSSPHLHKWRRQVHGNHGNSLDVLADTEQSSQGRVKVMCTQGVIYRFVRGPSPGVEIHPGDGSLLRSSGLSGHYFIHWLHKAGKVEEKVYAVAHPPPDVPGQAYSIQNLLRRGARLLEHLCEENMNLLDTSEVNSKCCWKLASTTTPLQPPCPSTLLEQCSVPGLGRFTARSSGRVKVVFEDRTNLEMVADFSKRITAESRDGNPSDTPGVMRPPLYPRDLHPGVCRLLLPSGHYHNVHVSDPGEYQRYVDTALQWVDWVIATPAERRDFYRDTVHDSDAWERVQREAHRLHCFNYIVEQTMFPNSASEVPTQATTAPACAIHGVQTATLPVFPGALATNTSPSATTPTSMATRGGGVSSWLPGSEGGGGEFYSVQDVLKQTSRAIKDLDEILGSTPRQNHQDGVR